MGGRRGNRLCLCIERGGEEAARTEVLEGDVMATALEQGPSLSLCASVVGIWKHICNS